MYVNKNVDLNFKLIIVYYYLLIVPITSFLKNIN